MQKENLRFYEQVLVLKPDTFEKDHKEICSLIADIIQKEKGEIFRSDTWGSRPISNPKAKGFSRGWYFYMVFSAASNVISEIRRQLSINNKVLYYHQEKLPKKEVPADHVEKFFQNLEETVLREKERSLRNQKKHSFGGRPKKF